MISKEGSFYLGHLGPIPLYIHWSFLFLVWMIVGPYVGHGGSIETGLVVLTVLVIGILLHELGHGYAAIATGGRTLSITMWALGGVCHSTGTRYPKHELIIVLAGPAVSAILAVGCAISFTAIDQTHPEWLRVLDMRGVPTNDLTLPGLFLAAGETVNTSLLIFNMMPIYPLDGGQAVHNLMRMFLPIGTANRAAMIIAVLGAIGYVIWRTNETGEPSLFLIFMLGYLLFNAWHYLR